MEKPSCSIILYLYLSMCRKLKQTMQEEEAAEKL